MPVFVFIMTKFKNLPEKIFEVCLEDGIKPTRLKSEVSYVFIISKSNTVHFNAFEVNWLCVIGFVVKTLYAHFSLELMGLPVAVAQPDKRL